MSDDREVHDEPEEQNVFDGLAASAEPEMLEVRVDRYLEGSMSSAEALRFERDLLQPEVARAFGAELMLRELLETTPQAQPPDHLTAEIEDALRVASFGSGRSEHRPSADELAEMSNAERTAKQKGSMLNRLESMLAALRWSLKGPAMAVQTAEAASYASVRIVGRLQAVPVGSSGAITEPSDGFSVSSAPDGARNALITMSEGFRGAASGLSCMRYALGPLAKRDPVSTPTSRSRREKSKNEKAKRGEGPSRAKRRRWWRRALGRLTKK